MTINNLRKVFTVLVLALCSLGGALAYTAAAGAVGAAPIHSDGTSAAFSHTSSGAAIFTNPTTGDVSYLPKGVKSTSLGVLYADVKDHQITKATLDPTQDLIFFNVRATATHKAHHYATAYIDSAGASVQSYLLAHGVNLTIGVISGLGAPTAFPWALLVLFFFGFFIITNGLLRHRREKIKLDEANKNGDSLTLAAAKKGPGAKHGGLIQATIPETRFTDVAGCDEAVTDLAEFVEFLRDPQRFAVVGATIPKGALLCGPPGTGKTLLARAVAGEAGVPFFATDGAAFAEIYVGTGPKRIRELFAEARKVAPSIIFIDEVDAIAKKRSSSANHSESERESTLISLLSEMDGFRDSKVIVLAATNRADVLDEALTRPGRLDRRIEVPLPDRRGREKILAVHFGERPINSDVDVEALARRTSGMSGADLAQVVNEACIEAARATQTTVSVQNFDQAVATVAMGRARISALVTEADRKLTAWHEAGHTICAYVQDAADKPVSVSIIPRGPAGGVTWMSEGDELFMQRSKASARLVTALGGRAAEELLLGDDYTQGAYGDLTTATNLAFSMATRYGMTSLGLMVRDSSILGSAANEGVADVVEDLLTGALDGARAILAEHRDFMEALVAALLDNDTLVASEITKIYESVGCPGARSPKAILNSRGRQAAPAPTASQPPVSHTPTPPVRELAPAGLIERVALYTNALANVHRHHRKSTKRSSPETTM